jgi:hypothetical protein
MEKKFKPLIGKAQKIPQRVNAKKIIVGNLVVTLWKTKTKDCGKSTGQKVGCFLKKINE